MSTPAIEPADRCSDTARPRPGGPTTVRPLPRAVLTGAAVATMLLAPAAHAIPPLAVSGSGTLSPGVLIPSAPHEVSLAFTGTGSDAAGTTCGFSGTGRNTPSGGVWGLLSGQCGPFPYEVCPFTLSQTSFSFACATGATGSFSAAYDGVVFVTGFTASGVIAP